MKSIEKKISKMKIGVVLIGLILGLGVGINANAANDLIINSGFENDFVGWDKLGPVIGYSGYHHSGSKYAVLGAANNCEDNLSQTVDIPATANSALLSYWYNITSEESNNLNVPFDELTVTIRDSGDNILKVVDSISNLDKDSCAVSSCYHQITFDMKDYIGQTVKVYFYSKTDGSYVTYFRIDDVNLMYTQNQLSDLIVEDIQVTPDPPEASGYSNWTITIKNQSNQNINELFYLECYFDGGYIGKAGFSGLTANSSTSTTWKKMIWPADTSSHNIKGVVDSDGVVNETNESNNTRTESFVATPIPVDIGTLYIETVPKEANVYIDNVYKGVSPPVGYLRINDLTAGEHSIKVTKSGYYDWYGSKLVVANSSTYKAVIMSVIPVTETCYDGIKNQDETDIDCGGSCPACASGKKCNIDNDCQNNSCIDGACERFSSGIFDISVSDSPDPFNPSLGETNTITITNTGDSPCGEVTLSIENTSRSWQWYYLASGNNLQAIWNGRDEAGNIVSAGVYNYTVFCKQEQMVLSGFDKVASYIIPTANAFFSVTKTGTITVLGSDCGNGILEEGEDCDDGNNLDGDGCSSICKFQNIVSPVIYGCKYFDQNNNGIIDDLDTKLSDWEIQLFECGWGGEPSNCSLYYPQITDEIGCYKFNDIGIGTWYQVREMMQNDWEQTYITNPNPFLLSNESIEIDFANYKYESYCGDGILGNNEECDGSDFGGQSCESLGFDGGSLGCDGFCEVVTSGCDDESENIVFVQDVLYFFQGLKNNKSRINLNVSDPVNIIGKENGLFISLGSDGEIILRLPHGVLGVSAVHINEVDAINYALDSDVIEKAEIYISEDGENWNKTGIAESDVAIMGLRRIRISVDSEFSDKCIHYIKIKDNTTNDDVDGFDLESVSVTFDNACSAVKEKIPTAFFEAGNNEDVHNSKKNITFNAYKSSCYCSDRNLLYKWDWNGDNIIDTIDNYSPTFHSWSTKCFHDDVEQVNVSLIAEDINGNKSIYKTPISLKKQGKMSNFKNCWNGAEEISEKVMDRVNYVDSKMRDYDKDGKHDEGTSYLDWARPSGSELEWLEDRDIIVMLSLPMIADDNTLSLSYLDSIYYTLAEEELVDSAVKHVDGWGYFFPHKMSRAFIGITEDVAINSFMPDTYSLILQSTGSVIAGAVYTLKTAKILYDLNTVYEEMIGEESYLTALGYYVFAGEIRDDKLAKYLEEEVDPENYESVYNETINYFKKLEEEYRGHVGNEYGVFDGYRQKNREELKILASNAINNNIISLEPFYLIELNSPGDIQIHDFQGRVTGLVNGEIVEEIPNSVYDDENHIVVIFASSDSYFYKVVGTDTGTYGLTITSVVNGEEIIFKATDIPTTSNEVHQYSIDWKALANGEEGVTVQMDKGGDGEFEETFTTGNILDMSVNLETQIAITEMEYSEGNDILSAVTADVGDGIAPLLLSELKESTVDLEDYTPNGKLESGQKKKLKMKFKFLETAGNEYQGKSINVKFKFLGTQEER